MEKEVIKIPPIELEWNDWISWDDLKIDAKYKSGIRVPNGPGVYEVKYRDTEEWLTIGKASNLRMRIKQGLVKGKVPHSTGERIRRANEDTSRIVVRWATTDRPATVEEELHRSHRENLVNFPNIPSTLERLK